MKELTEPLLPDTHHASVENTADKKSVTLIRFVTVGTITIITFLLFIIILASQLPPQQTMGRTTVASQEQFTGGEGTAQADNEDGDTDTDNTQAGYGLSMENTGYFIISVGVAVTLIKLLLLVRIKEVICLSFRVTRRMKRYRSGIEMRLLTQIFKFWFRKFFQPLADLPGLV